jgi:hypothetical protein
MIVEKKLREAQMEELVSRVADALGVDATVAKTAIGHVLAFLIKELPEGPVAEFMDQTPGARAAAEAVGSGGDAGGGSVLGGLFGSGLMGLAGKLNAAGLDMTQIRQLGQEILAHAETVVGKEKVREIAGRIPGLSQFL